MAEIGWLTDALVTAARRKCPVSERNRPALVSGFLLPSARLLGTPVRARNRSDNASLVSGCQQFTSTPETRR
jgi:hypothetical protein